LAASRAYLGFSTTVGGCTPLSLGGDRRCGMHIWGSWWRGGAPLTVGVPGRPGTPTVGVRFSPCAFTRLDRCLSRDLAHDICIIAKHESHMIFMISTIMPNLSGETISHRNKPQLPTPNLFSARSCRAVWQMAAPPPARSGHHASHPPAQPREGYPHQVLFHGGGTRSTTG